MALLFVYGTLLDKNVQRVNFGRELIGTKDQLAGYAIGEVKITDERVIRESGKDIHRILKYTGSDRDRVEGTVFEVTEEELKKADEYEVDDYERVSTILKSGRKCWAYVAPQDEKQH